MGTGLFSNCLSPFRYHPQPISRYPAQSKRVVSSPMATRCSLERGCGGCTDAKGSDEESKPLAEIAGRRGVLISGFSLISAVLGFPADGSAVKQGLLAGRIPGLSEPDGNGWRTYRRPDDKSGGHGVGWSPIIPYTFRVPGGWEEVPVSIADLGGTEIDLRFASSKEGRLFVIVAPVRRFADLEEDNAKIEDIGPPEKVIDAFGPEVIGESVEGKVLSSEVTEHDGRTYYQFELEPPHALITATAAGNRLYLFNITGSGKHHGLTSFSVVMGSWVGDCGANAESSLWVASPEN